MEYNQPQFIANREFVELEEEDIQKLNQVESQKFEHNPEVPKVMSMIEQELGPGGRWEEHWLALDHSGRRVFTRLYYTADQALALTAAGEIIREIRYPADDQAFH